MTDSFDATDGSGSHDRTTHADGSTSGPSRREFVQAASAGAGAMGLGATLSGAASANQGDGPGQTISTPKLSTDGNHIVDPEGNTVKLRGLNVVDPKILDLTAQVRGKTAIQAIDFLTNRDQGWHPRVIRLPIEPGNIAELPPVPVTDQYETGDYPIGEFDRDDVLAYCEDHLDAVVDRCEERNVYCIVDYHRHWGSGNQTWDDPDLGPEVELFWDVMADRYGDRDHVLFEVYNEPTQPGMWSDPLGEHGDNYAQVWHDWKETAQPWVDKIREYTDNLIIVGSPSWSASPEGALVEPFEGGNLAYTYHIYGGHLASLEQDWDNHHGNGTGLSAGGTPVYEEYPLFVTEFGWERTTITSRHIQGTTEDFGEPFVEFMEERDSISWTAWCADPVWRPIMFNRPWVEENISNDPAHVDAVGDPYNEELEVLCEEPPCEWELLEDGDHGMPWAGDTIKSTLAEKKDHLVPEGEKIIEPRPDPPENLTVADVGATSLGLEWDAVDSAEEYRVYVDGSEAETVTEPAVTLTDLSEETEYTVGVATVATAIESEQVEVTATTGTDGENPCEEAGGTAETLSDGTTVCDVDGDGEYRDVTGDGSVTNSDVTEFFGNQHADPWDSRADLFDFTGDDDVTQADVIELFGSVN